jgi:DNA-binding NarL/FixJ family response regulator
MPRSVLVVDDDASFRELASRTLRAWGYTVIGEAGTFDEAVERAATLRPDSALVDMGRRDGDGVAPARHPAAMAPAPRIVLISSDSDAANGAMAQRMGATGFVPKDELLGTHLRELLGGPDR